MTSEHPPTGRPDTPDSHQAHAPLPSADELSELPRDGGERYNRLVFELSPYLLQHAVNPVDWYPWGDAAFERARREDKPVMLSIGYSTCHWCHVMERESFQDDTVAAVLNRACVCIKVDREERPDIDHIYMKVCQAMTGSGGWPLTVFMTPDRKPFFAATYLPKEDRGAHPGLLTLVPRISRVWTGDRQRLLDSAGQVVNFLRQDGTQQSDAPMDDSLLDAAYVQLRQQYDPQQGGFGSAPKFPAAHNLLFLLHHGYRTGAQPALDMVETTLRQMRLGGIYDHVGGGFHRYSTDARWLVPHFEKMLYDQAMLCLAYVEAYQATGKDGYARTAGEILGYVEREMTSPEGGFYSAQDADSEGEEGLFYVWTPAELEQVLGPDEGAFMSRLLNVESGGNYTDEASGRRTGRSILHLRRHLAETAADCGIAVEALEERWQRARSRLLTARARRVPPLRDDKILSDWNGLMLAAFARAAAALQEPRYATVARRAADFVWDRLRAPDGRLYKRFRQGQAGLPAHLDDYAFTVWGLLELYQARFDARILHRAVTLNQRMLDEFGDPGGGPLFFAPAGQEDLLVRLREMHDGAMPSGNSVAVMNLLRLARLTASPQLEDRAWSILRALSGPMHRQPLGHIHLLSALSLALGRGCEVVVVGAPQAADTQAMLDALQRRHQPGTVVLWRPPDAAAAAPLAELAPFTAAYGMVDHRATAYVCRDHVCAAPVTDPEQMLALLG